MAPPATPPSAPNITNATDPPANSPENSPSNSPSADGARIRARRRADDPADSSANYAENSPSAEMRVDVTVRRRHVHQNEYLPIMTLNSPKYAYYELVYSTSVQVVLSGGDTEAIDGPSATLTYWEEPRCDLHKATEPKSIASTAYTW